MQTSLVCLCLDCEPLLIVCVEKKNTSVNVGFYRMAFGFEMLARR